MSEHPFSPDPLASYVAHLWARKWWIILLTALAVGVSALLLQYVVSETYEASACLFVKNREYSSAIERKTLTPVAYNALLLSDELLSEAREEMARLAPPEPGKKFPDFDRFKNACQVITATEADTTVRRDFSPVITMRVEWNTAEGARLAVDLWAKGFIRKYGSLLANEAASRVAAAKAQYDKAMEQSRTLEAERAAAEAQFGFRRQLLAFKQNLLAPAPVPAFEATNSYLMKNDSYYQNLNVDAARPSFENAERGLMADAVRLEIEIAAAAENPNPALTRQLQATEQAAQTLTSEIAALQSETAELDKRRSILADQIAAAKTQLQVFSENIADLSLDLRDPSKPADSEYEGSDVRIASRPVLHEQRIAPKKRLTVMGVAAAAFLFASLFFILEKYLRGALAANSL